MTETVLASLVQALQRTAVVNQADRVPPSAILWPDPDRAWDPLISDLREQLPLLTLGPWDEPRASGPALWIRCVVGGELLPAPPDDQAWVIWLPGVRRDDLRAVEEAPTPLRALAELQYRAEWWTQRDRSAWTPASWLASQNGLGLKVGRDQATREALELALREVFALAVDGIRSRGGLDADYLMGLVSRDEVRTLLLWLNDPAGTQASLSAQEWQVFLAQVKKEFGVDLPKAGVLTVAERLGAAEPPWDKVWNRYAESPSQYGEIPTLLRQAKSHLLSDPLHWPQDNEDAEADVRRALAGLGGGQPAEARDQILSLEAEHAPRRDSVWGRLGHAPLAQSLRHLSELATATALLPHGDSAAAFVSWYTKEGHTVDAAAVAAIGAVRAADRDAVAVAVRTIYYQWLDDATRRYQAAVLAEGYRPTMGLKVDDGDCVVFVDGLRFDLGVALKAALAKRGIDVSLEHRLAPLPSVTATGKAALMPFAADVVAGAGFDVRHSGKALHISDALAHHGVSVLAPFETSTAGSRGWTEAADVDKTGHNLKLTLAERVDGQMADVASRVQDLLSAGWTRVLVVTDHGWLLMPGGLNRQDLPEALTEERKPRAARLKAGADDAGYPVQPYVYDDRARIVSPHGIAAFQAGQVYDHGGLSLQECVVPVLTATSAEPGAGAARISDTSWVGMRCRVQVHAAPAGAVVDIRRSPGDGTTTLVTKTKATEGDDEVTLLVADDELEGSDAYVVLLSDAGGIVSQVTTKIGR